MKKYVCSVCGYTYDEEREGITWDEQPEEFECPVCCVSKDQFEEKEN